MIIDSHAHFVPRPIIDALRGGKPEFPNLASEATDNSVKLSFSGGAWTRSLSPGLFDAAQRLDWMDSQNIDRQVVGPWLDMTGYELPEAEGVAWSTWLNAELLSFSKDNARFVPLATLPLQSGEAAAKVLRDCMRDGFHGAMIGTQPKGKGGVLDDADLAPFWQAASETGAAVVIHPMYDCGDRRADNYGMANAIGRITDTALTLTRMLYAGMPSKYSGAKIVIPIGGAALPFVMGRLMRNYALHKDELANPQEGFGALWFDTVVHDAATLKFLADQVGWSRIMMGSDKPFPIGDPEPLGIVDACDLNAADRDAVVRGTATDLFRLQ
ncbi:MAG: amidohydrolase family protein [Hyphomicrobiaceae bacterium]